jgi:hypothetical protein
MMLPSARSSSAVSRRGGSGRNCTALWGCMCRRVWSQKAGGARGTGAMGWRQQGTGRGQLLSGHRQVM